MNLRRAISAMPALILPSLAWTCREYVPYVIGALLAITFLVLLVKVIRLALHIVRHIGFREIDRGLYPFGKIPPHSVYPASCLYTHIVVFSPGNSESKVRARVRRSTVQKERENASARAVAPAAAANERARASVRIVSVNPTDTLCRVPACCI